MDDGNDIDDISNDNMTCPGRGRATDRAFSVVSIDQLREESRQSRNLGAETGLFGLEVIEEQTDTIVEAVDEGTNKVIGKVQEQGGAVIDEVQRGNEHLNARMAGVEQELASLNENIQALRISQEHTRHHDTENTPPLGAAVSLSAGPVSEVGGRSVTAPTKHPEAAERGRAVSKGKGLVPQSDESLEEKLAETQVKLLDARKKLRTYETAPKAMATETAVPTTTKQGPREKLATTKKIAQLKEGNKKRAKDKSMHPFKNIFY